MVINLLTNAVQAIEDGSSITVTTRQEGNWAVVDIADIRHGIEPAKLERVFDPGFTTKGGGVDVGFVYRLPYHRGAQGLDRAPERSG